jgi:hypothetical protein
VGAGPGVAATVGWVAAGPSNAHADADEAEVIRNWSNTAPLYPPGPFHGPLVCVREVGGELVWCRCHDTNHP